MDEIICGHCGQPMVLREIAPCLDCGGDPKELAHLKSGDHYYVRVELFGGEVLCDFCCADMPSTDPLYWGFPRGFDWDVNLYSPSQEIEAKEIVAPQTNQELACPAERCHNTLRKQKFIVQNAKRYGVVLPKEYWQYLNI